MEPLLEVNNLEVSFQATQIVRGVSFHLDPGETLAIVGESGCGKSITALSVMGLLRKEGATLSGSIRFEGGELLGLPESAYRKIRGRRIGMVFQDPMTSLNPLIKIGRQITETIRCHRGATDSEAKERTYALLDRVGITESKRRFNQYPHELSGGMRQRVMIALALSCEPCLLIADEPTTALDVTIQAQILELLKSIQEETKASILIITHDLGVVAGMADRMVVMYAGEVMEEGPTEPLFATPSHPYTKGLLQSVPRRVAEGHPLRTIRGSPPDLSIKTIGCPFVPRCDYAMEICRRRDTFHAKISRAHHCSCWLHHPKAKQQKTNFERPL